MRFEAWSARPQATQPASFANYTIYHIQLPETMIASSLNADNSPTRNGWVSLTMSIVRSTQPATFRRYRYFK